MSEYKINELKWALFLNKKDFFKDLKIYHNRKKFLKKHGYAESALFDTAGWFICVMEEILTYYRYNRDATPIIIKEFDLKDQDCSFEKNNKAFNELLDKMLDLLKKMDEGYYPENMLINEVDEKTNKAKKEFFKLFSKYFFFLWQ